MKGVEIQNVVDQMIIRICICVLLILKLIYYDKNLQDHCRDLLILNFCPYYGEFKTLLHVQWATCLGYYLLELQAIFSFRDDHISALWWKLSQKKTFTSIVALPFLCRDSAFGLCSAWVTSFNFFFICQQIVMILIMTIIFSA